MSSASNQSSRTASPDRSLGSDTEGNHLPPRANLPPRATSAAVVNGPVSAESDQARLESDATLGHPNAQNGAHDQNRLASEKEEPSSGTSNTFDMDAMKQVLGPEALDSALPKSKPLSFAERLEQAQAAKRKRPFSEDKTLPSFPRVFSQSASLDELADVAKEKLCRLEASGPLKKIMRQSENEISIRTDLLRQQAHERREHFYGPDGPNSILYYNNKTAVPSLASLTQDEGYTQFGLVMG